ncbi:glycosyltransferase family 4 protein [Lichenifustis flavocetrariae]|uniref:Glycosyltransferase family 4 protein n=1 Tax=Lichenifustis flavocetrariae TaxID=2949735 RepID=A0AA41YZC0_9HYPH|nr:glycosyltransferase family 4 protein [Lichenifustis flavocetrariae]MCW6511339.1 glycosyltransferase family 4 protein [Lichenifustis flavocetrariae]
MTAVEASNSVLKSAVKPASGATPRLKVAQVVTRMDIGGVPDHVMTLVRGLHRDCDLVVLCASIDAKHARELEALSVPVIKVPFARLPLPKSDFRVLLELIHILRAGRFDVVHTHMSKAVLIGALAARLARVPLVVNTAHNLGFLALPNPLFRGLFWVYDRVLFAVACDLIVTVSQQVRDAVVRAGIAPGRKVIAIPNGIDPQRFDVPPELRLTVRSELAPDDDLLIVTVARLVWFKGLDMLLDAAPAVLAHHPRTKIVIVGDGPLRAELSARCAKLGIERQVVFTGERRDIPALLAAADIFVLPSVSEGMPISILEAMAAGKAVVATRVGGVPDLVLDGDTGCLVESRDAGGLAAALIRLADNPALRDRMGCQGAARLSRMFSADAMVERTLALYHLNGARSLARG